MKTLLSRHAKCDTLYEKMTAITDCGWINVWLTNLMIIWPLRQNSIPRLSVDLFIWKKLKDIVRSWRRKKPGLHETLLIPIFMLYSGPQCSKSNTHTLDMWQTLKLNKIPFNFSYLHPSNRFIHMPENIIGKSVTGMTKTYTKILSKVLISEYFK